MLTEREKHSMGEAAQLIFKLFFFFGGGVEGDTLLEWKHYAFCFRVYSPACGRSHCSSRCTSPSPSSIRLTCKKAVLRCYVCVVSCVRRSCLCCLLLKQKATRNCLLLSFPVRNKVSTHHLHKIIQLNNTTTFFFKQCEGSHHCNN